VTDYTKLSRADYIERLLQTELTVAMFGFLPGFVYFQGLDKSLHVPRKTSPTSRTSPNAFAIGGPYAGVYSLPSPAGWNVLGQIPWSLLQTNKLPPMALQPGDKITLTRVDEEEFTAMQQQGPAFA